jgi:hypothetical protein
MSLQNDSRNIANETVAFYAQCKHIVDEMLAITEMVGAANVIHSARYLDLSKALLEAAEENMERFN